MENKINFTKAIIDALSIPESGKRNIYHDTKISGLQLRVTSVKTFFINRRIKGGGPQRITLGRYPDMTIEQARRKTLELVHDIAEGKNPADRLREAKREMTLSDLFQEYMERRAAFNRRPDKPQATYRLYLSDWSNRKLSSIKHEEVDRLHKKIGRNSGQVTANIVLKLLHVMFNKAINEWRIWKGENPAHGIAKFPEQSRDRFLQSDELPRFFQAVAEEENETIRDYVLISLLTGARRSNVLAMRWQDINFDRAEWRIEETKNGTPQTVTLSPEVIEILQNRKPSDGAVFVFPGSGKSLHLEEPKKGWKRILERAGIEDLRLHDLRRTLGSWQAKTGASLAIIGKSLNHKNQNTTAIYARLDLDPVRESVNKATSAMLTAAGLKNEIEVMQFKKKIRHEEVV
jgi:integrase